VALKRIAALMVVVSALSVAAQQAPPVPRTPRTSAPIDITGYWVAVITEDWRWRMLTPPKGDYASVPLNDEGRRVADSWNLAKDEAAGLACKPYGIGNIMRMPRRMHISWQDDAALKVEFDAGTQTRLLRFGPKPDKIAPPTWQGYSAAQWQFAGPQGTVDRNNTPNGPSPAGAGLGPRDPARVAPSRGGSLFVATTNFRDGYLRKNGVPYSEQASITEYFHRLPTHPNGDVWLHVITAIDDPRYLTQTFYTSTSFRREASDANFKPSACTTAAPLPVKASTK
jgi:hypothetical protein